MINLAWNTQGRLGRRAYKDMSGGLGWMTVAAIVLAAVVGLNFTQHNMALSVAAVGVISVVVFYLQYRAAQLSIRRLHDRNLPGFLLWPMLLVGVAMLGYGAYGLVRVMYDANLFGFVGAVFELLTPFVQLLVFNGIGLSVTVGILLYNLFISYNLNAEGKVGDNRYGPDPRD